MWRQGVCLSLFLLVSLDSHARRGECHIHPPVPVSGEAADIIGPFPTWRACELERKRRFGSFGRCHCRADFTPPWLPREPVKDDVLAPPDLL